jgi:hypothetical protein
LALTGKEISNLSSRERMKGCMCDGNEGGFQIWGSAACDNTPSLMRKTNSTMSTAPHILLACVPLETRLTYLQKLCFVEMTVDITSINHCGSKMTTSLSCGESWEQHSASAR